MIGGALLSGLAFAIALSALSVPCAISLAGVPRSWNLMFSRGVLLAATIAMGVALGAAALSRQPVIARVATGILVPLMFLRLAGAIRAIDPVALRAAASMGASPWRRFSRLVLPEIATDLVANAALALAVGVFVNSAGLRS